MLPQAAASSPASRALDAICRDFDLDALYVFGSRTDEVAAAVRSGEDLQSANSDIDIGVLPASRTTLGAQARARLTMALEGLFSSARVDLVILTEAPPFLALDIVTGELLAVRDRDRVAEYELFVLRRAGDLAPFERERRRMILEESAQ